MTVNTVTTRDAAKMLRDEAKVLLDLASGLENQRKHRVPAEENLDIQRAVEELHDTVGENNFSIHMEMDVFDATPTVKWAVYIGEVGPHKPTRYSATTLDEALSVACGAFNALLSKQPAHPLEDVQSALQPMASMPY